MKILILANFPSKLDGKLNGRFVYLSDMLFKRGHEVEMIVSDFYHIEKKHRSHGDMRPDLYPFKITYLHEPGYPNNIHPKRLWSHYVWGKNVAKYLKAMSYTPDLIYVDLPSLTVARSAASYCKKKNVPMFIDVQDLWPEAFLVKFKNPFIQMCFKPMAWYANGAYKAADLMIGVSDTYRDRGLMVNKKDNKGLTVYLGNDGERFNTARDINIVSKPQDEFWLAYIGTMGYSYDIKCAIDAVKKVNEDKLLDKKVKFIAMGKGPLLEEYKQYAMNAKIEYDFTGALPYDQMVGLMCSCDAVINCLRPGAAQSITNKVGDYALSGLPVINTQENLEYRELVDMFQCGINCECGNSIQVADAIIKLATNEEMRIEMGKNARRLGNERFDRRISYLKLIEAIEKYN